MLFDLPNMLVNFNEQFPAFSYFLLFFIIFAESGLFFGFFFPGDSLLLVAGLLASQNIFNISTLLILLLLASFLGFWIGYLFGKKIGQSIYKKRIPFINKRHILNAKKFYQRHGTTTLILARFVPIIRTFVPIVAGATRMNLKKFLILNLIGGLAWTWSMLLLGFFLGTKVPNISHYFTPVIALIVIISLAVPLAEKFKNS